MTVTVTDVTRQFHKYLKVFEKKDSERMLIRKAWDHVIDLRLSHVYVIFM